MRSLFINQLRIKGIKSLYRNNQDQKGEVK